MASHEMILARAAKAVTSAAARRVISAEPVTVFVYIHEPIRYTHERQTMGATARIAEFIVNTNTSHFPEGSKEKAIKVIADTYAVILAGVSSEVSEPLQKYLESMRESGASPILGTGRTASPETAALINGTYGHSLDYDDVLSIMPAHPSAVILAAVLASIDGYTVSGKDFIEAYITGVEVGGKLGVGMTNDH